GADVVRHADAIDVEERLLAERDRRAAADVDARAGAGASTARRDDDARRACVQQLTDVVDARALELRAHVDAGDHVPDGTGLLAAGGTGDDDLVELDGGLGHEDAHVGRADARALRGGLEAQAAGLEGDLIASDAGDAEAPVRIGEAAELGALDLNGDSLER